LELEKLVAKLKAAGQHQYIFISMSKEKASFPLSLIQNRKTAWEQAGTCYSLGVFDIQ
jgi:hypothetical protein